jgi:hypothetical protein
MDKGSDRHEVIEIIKQRIKDLCIHLYDPYHGFLAKYDDQQDFGDLFHLHKKPKSAKLLFLKAMSKSDIKKLNQKLSAADVDQLENRLKSIGKRFFIENYNTIRFDEPAPYRSLSAKYSYTDKSIRDRISTMRPIFAAGHELTALQKCIHSPGVEAEALKEAGRILKSYFSH